MSQVDIPTHLNGIEYVRVVSVALNVKNVIVNDKLKCRQVNDVKRIGVDDAKKIDADVVEFSCSTLGVRCTTFV